ncbi:MAG: hypothetical protein Kow001_01520 [Acidobacteriota bacterium]
MRSVVLVWLLPGLAACSGDSRDTAGGEEPLVSLEVEAGGHDRQDCLLRWPLPPDRLPVRLIETTDGRAIPVPSQYDPASGELVWMAPGEFLQGTTRSFAILPGEDRSRSAGLVRDPDGRALELQVRGEKVLRYNCAPVSPPDPSMPASLARAAYIHPVWAPSGKVVTDDFHPDHAHQRGIWMAWTETRLEGRTPDFWNLPEGTGVVRLAGIQRILEGPVFAGVDARHEHVDLSAPGGELPVLEEQFEIRAYVLGGKKAGFFLMDVRSRQRNVAAGPLELPEYHYGGFGVRGARSWTPDILSVRTSAGKDRASADGSREHWILMEGPLGDGNPAGIAVFGHPENFRSPQPVRMHPEMQYFSFSPQRLGGFEIAPGSTLVSQYRVLVYDGSAPESTLQAFWWDYAEPPAVRAR